MRIESSGNRSNGNDRSDRRRDDPGTSDIETLFVDSSRLTESSTQSSSGPTFSFAIPGSFSTLVAIATATDGDGGTGSGTAQIVPIFVDNAQVTINSSGITVFELGEQPPRQRA